MIIDHSCTLSGISISRVSSYLSLCNLDLLVDRKECKPSAACYVNHPGNAGTASVISDQDYLIENHCSKSDIYQIEDMDISLIIKKEFSKLKDVELTHLSKAGSIALRQRNGEIMELAIYHANLKSNTTLQTRSQVWRFCLVQNKQDKWVNAFLAIARKRRYEIDSLFNVSNGKFQVENIYLGQRRK